VRASRLRRRYGRAYAGRGYVETAWRKGRWVTAYKPTPGSDNVLDVTEDRGAAVRRGQKEAQARSVPFVMGV
jgi:hypothetical protein